MCIDIVYFVIIASFVTNENNALSPQDGRWGYEGQWGVNFRLEIGVQHNVLVVYNED